jgi:pimeloyl-ACP methyl ester carboxylesterase
MAGVAEDVLLAADQLGWTQFHLVGHSMGGMVAQRLLVDVPDRLESIVLLAPVPASGARLDPARRALLLRAIAEPEARRALIDANTGGVRPAAWIQQLLDTSLRSTRPDVLEAYLHSWSDTDFSPELKETTVPIQLILGELDPGATSERMQGTILRWFPHARMEIVRGAGHYPMLEQPEELNRMLARHLRSTS